MDSLIGGRDDTTTTMRGMRDVIDALGEAGLRDQVKVLIDSNTVIIKPISKIKNPTMLNIYI